MISAAGNTIFFIVSDFVAPKAYEPSRSEFGTDRITSSLSEETKGIIITDHMPEAAFYMVGGMDEAIEKAKKLEAEAA